jgi:hypothetical protein
VRWSSCISVTARKSTCCIRIKVIRTLHDRKFRAEKLHTPCLGLWRNLGRRKCHRGIGQRSGGVTNSHKGERHTVCTSYEQDISSNSSQTRTGRLYCDFLYQSFEFRMMLRKVICQQQTSTAAVKHALILLDSDRLPKLCCSRTVKVEADHPHSCFIQNLPFLPLILRLHRRDLVQVQISRDTVTQKHALANRLPTMQSSPKENR